MIHTLYIERLEDLKVFRVLLNDLFIYFVHNEQVEWRRTKFVQYVFVVGLVGFLWG